MWNAWSRYKFRLSSENHDTYECLDWSAQFEVQYLSFRLSRGSIYICMQLSTCSSYLINYNFNNSNSFIFMSTGTTSLFLICVENAKYLFTFRTSDKWCSSIDGAASVTLSGIYSVLYCACYGIYNKLMQYINMPTCI